MRLECVFSQYPSAPDWVEADKRMKTHLKKTWIFKLHDKPMMTVPRYGRNLAKKRWAGLDVLRIEKKTT